MPKVNAATTGVGTGNFPANDKPTASAKAKVPKNSASSFFIGWILTRSGADRAVLIFLHQTAHPRGDIRVFRVVRQVLQLVRVVFHVQQHGATEDVLRESPALDAHT